MTATALAKLYIIISDSKAIDIKVTKGTKSSRRQATFNLIFHKSSPEVFTVSIPTSNLRSKPHSTWFIFSSSKTGLKSKLLTRLTRKAEK